jgi:alkanesulfonate monooxygenase SsuD/methylene tetrahydromethanopterin reductase-like flavin-dependent oxidoreductase (luciferase family)
MRIGIIVLPELDWAHDRDRWVRADELGFDHAWTYDHLSWRTLADGPWHATVPTLTAAALATSRIRIGTLVTSPNYRHPVPLAKDLMTLDVMAEGRLDIALGAGGTGFDASVLGDPPLTARQRHERFVEFTGLLDRLLRDPVTDWVGEWYAAVAARMIPGPVQSPRPPLVVAANGPRGMALARATARRPGDGWVTIGTADAAEHAGEWWDGVARAAARMDDVLAGHAPPGFVRMLNLESRLRPDTSVDDVAADVRRAADLGFTDVTLAWPRASDPYRGRASLLDELGTALPELRRLGG